MSTQGEAVSKTKISERTAFIGIIVGMVLAAIPVIFAYIDAKNELAIALNQINVLSLELTSGPELVPVSALRGSPEANSVSFPFDLETQFHPTGWMGDGTNGEDYISLDYTTETVNNIDKGVIEIQYKSGPEGWAGMYWQYPEKNWGQQPGKNLVGATAITFLARGSQGGEIVEFKAGGPKNKEAYPNSLEVPLGKVTLSSDWKEYTINLSGKDLSNVIGAFAWIAELDEKEEITFYITDLVIR